MNFLFGRRLNLFDCLSLAALNGLYQSDKIGLIVAIILWIFSTIISVICERHAPYNRKLFS